MRATATISSTSISARSRMASLGGLGNDDVVDRAAALRLSSRQPIANDCQVVRLALEQSLQGDDGRGVVLWFVR